ncbi:T9SS type A sorting domain-containing protein [Calditrichota bacterium]
MKAILPCISLLVLISPAFSQLDSLWSYTYGGRYSESCCTLIQTADQGFALAGDITVSPYRHFQLIKTDSAGNQDWIKSYGALRYSYYCYSAIQTLDDGFVLVGASYTPGGESDYDYLLIRTDSDGDTLWSKKYGGTGGDYCSSVIQTPDSGFVLAGYSWSFGAGYSDAWLLKVSSNGDSIWSVTFGDIYNDYCNSMIFTKDSCIVFAGEFLYPDSSGMQDFWLVKIDNSGRLIWSRTYDVGELDMTRSVIQTADSGFVIVGSISPIENFDADWLVLKTNSTGDSLWSQTFGGSENDYCNSVIQTADGGFMLAGDTWSFSRGYSDTWLIETDTYGDSLWSKTFGGTNSDDCRSLVQTNDNCLALAGGTNSFGEGDYDFWLLKVGQLEVVHGNNIANSPGRFELRNIFPNPFNSTVKITINLPYQTNVTLNIYNITGKQVATLIKGELSPGIHTASWNPENLASGIYFAKLIWGTDAMTRKITLIR